MRWFPARTRIVEETERSEAREMAASAIPLPAFSVIMSSVKPSSATASCSISSIWSGLIQGQSRFVVVNRNEPLGFPVGAGKDEVETACLFGRGLAVREDVSCPRLTALT